MKTYKKYLLETTFLGALEFGEGDDGQPPDNVHMGLRYQRAPYKNRLTNYNTTWAVDDTEDFKWDWFWGCKSMEDPGNLHATIKGLEKIYPRQRLLKHFNTQPLTPKQVDKINIAKNEPERNPGQRLLGDPDVDVIVKVDPDPKVQKTAIIQKNTLKNKIKDSIESRIDRLLNEGENKK